MKTFQQRLEHLNGVQKRKLKAQQEKSVAKHPKINLFYNCAVPTGDTVLLTKGKCRLPTSSSSQQERILSIDKDVNSVIGCWKLKSCVCQGFRPRGLREHG